MRTYIQLFFALALIVAAAPIGIAADLDRTILPIPEPIYRPSTELNVLNAMPPPRFEVKAPAGAPNVIVAFVDDLGCAVKEKLKPGKATIKFDYAYDGSGMGKGGMGTLYINQKKVAQSRIVRTQPIVFSADETADVGIYLATPVAEAIGAERKSRYTGKIRKVKVEVR